MHGCMGCHPSSGLPGPTPAVNGGDEGREVLVWRSPWSSLGPSLARELSAGCRSGVPEEVWELHPHPLWQLWVRIPMPVWGGRAGAAGITGPTGLLPALAKTLP